MNDVFGREIEVGDIVATNMHGYTESLITATVIGFTPKKVKIVRKDRWNNTRMVETLKFPSQLAIGVKNGIEGQAEEEPR